MTAQLPVVRVSSDSHRIIYPFAAVGLDYFGPLYVKTGPNRGVARIFQRGGGSHCVKHYRHGVSPRNIVGCLFKKRLTKGGSRAPQDPPSLRPCLHKIEEERHPEQALQMYIYLPKVSSGSHRSGRGPVYSSFINAVLRFVGRRGPQWLSTVITVPISEEQSWTLSRL